MGSKKLHPHSKVDGLAEGLRCAKAQLQTEALWDKKEEELEGNPVWDLFPDLFIHYREFVSEVTE